MSKFCDADEVLSFAIQQEEEAARFYEEQAEKMNRPEMRKVFLEFAKEEDVHKAKLLAIQKEPQTLSVPQQKVMNLKIADYVQAAPPVGPYMTYVEMLMVAMLREKEAFKLYSYLANATEDERLRTVFLVLAGEEAKHKLRLELEYDQEMGGEN